MRKLLTPARSAHHHPAVRTPAPVQQPQVPQSIVDMPISEQSNHTQDRQDKPLTSSILNDNIPSSPAAPIEPPVEAQEFFPEPTDDGNNELDHLVSISQEAEAKKARQLGSVAADPYISVMTGTVKPEEQQEAVQMEGWQMEATLQESHKARLEMEDPIRLAPWAKKETSPVNEAEQGMTLQEIQRIEAEKERKERQQREVQEARIMEER